MLPVIIILFISIASTWAGSFWEPRIIGGSIANNDRLYQVSLTSKGNHFCGGALVSDNHVVTAAHCVYGATSEISIRAGSLKRDHGKLYKVDLKLIKIMECYNPKTKDCDVAVIQIKERVLGALCLRLVSENKEPSDGALLTVTGWGKTSSGSGSLASDLQYAKLKKISRSNCRYSYTDINVITDNMMCAGEEKRNVCVGDSGGALVDTAGRLVGIVSHGVTDQSNDCNPKFPAVFSSIASPQINKFIVKNTS